MAYFFLYDFIFLNVHEERGHCGNQKSLLVIIAGHQTGQERSGSHRESLLLRNDAVSSLCKYLRMCSWVNPAPMCAQIPLGIPSFGVSA